jgi:hypothetical protein
VRNCKNWNEIYRWVGRFQNLVWLYHCLNFLFYWIFLYHLEFGIRHTKKTIWLFILAVTRWWWTFQVNDSSIVFHPVKHLWRRTLWGTFTPNDIEVFVRRNTVHGSVAVEYFVGTDHQRAIYQHTYADVLHAKIHWRIKSRASGKKPVWSVLVIHACLLFLVNGRPKFCP